MGEIIEFNGMKLPAGIPHGYKNGSIQRVDVSTGKVELLYDSCDGRKLSAPNDIVFDKNGGFWFSDFGKDLEDRHLNGGLFYAKPDGSSIRRIAHGTSFNGVGLSPDGRTVYTGMSTQRWILAFDANPAMDPPSNTFVAHIVADFPKRCCPDSMAIEADGTIAQACVVDPAGIARVNPKTGATELLDFGDPFSTNICFGGRDMKTAYITLSGSGRLAKAAWPAAGLRLPFNG
jgi:gluconolactonase